jgi:deoxyribose-phosphate aldolase
MILAPAAAGKNIKTATEKMQHSLSSYIEHTILKPDTTSEQIKKICDEAIQYNFYAVCVPPYYVKDAISRLNKTKVKTVTVISFPFGYGLTPVKVEECRKAIDEGVDELDMVMNIAAFKDANYKEVQRDIQSVGDFSHLHNKIVKVIIETSLLNNDEIKKACDLSTKAGADFVKTSTGYNGSGVTVEHIKLLRGFLSKKVKIKASGGIKDKAFAIDLINNGADRIGTSSGVKIVGA